MRTIRQDMRMLSGPPWWMLAYEYARAVRLRLFRGIREADVHRVPTVAPRGPAGDSGASRH